jgi:hypothetical protein
MGKEKEEKAELLTPHLARRSKLVIKNRTRPLDLEKAKIW